MIITRTPFRISFFGGGTDYPQWFKNYGGAIISTSINKYCYLNCRRLPPFFGYRNRIVWSQIETVNDINEIMHPAVREALKIMHVDGIEIHHNGDLPSRAGLGSSSSFAVGLIHALNQLTGGKSTKKNLALSAIHLEQQILSENVGIQDQIAAAFGGLNKIEIKVDGSFKVSPIKITIKRKQLLESSLLMFYTGISRNASDIAAEQIKQIPNKVDELRRIQSLTYEAIDILESNKSLDEFGYLLHEAWTIKRSLSNLISPKFIDEIYGSALKAGALGGKLLGAGGGGFMLFYVSPDRQKDVLKALSHLMVIPIKFENFGSQIIFYEPDNFSKLSLSGKSFFNSIS